jgi:RimJ/RimL family protein N-acetyltransferase
MQRQGGAGPRVRLEVLTPGHPLRPAVVELTVRPEQEEFALTASTTLAAADADPGRTPFAILVRGPALQPQAVGFGVLDRGGYLPELLDSPERAVLLRAFYVDVAHQGRGIGTAAARATRSLAATMAGVELVVLTVNVRNAAGVAAYRRAGFADTGARYLLGDAGPQHVLVAGVVRAPAADSAPRTPETADTAKETAKPAITRLS